MRGGTIAMENGAVCLKTQNQDPRAPWQGTSGVYPKELALTNTCAARVTADRGGSGGENALRPPRGTPQLEGPRPDTCSDVPDLGDTRPSARSQSQQDRTVGSA